MEFRTQATWKYNQFTDIAKETSNGISTPSWLTRTAAFRIILAQIVSGRTRLVVTVFARGVP